MKIDKLIEELKRVRKEEGNIEVTCTGSDIRENPEDPFCRAWETTVENLVVHDHKNIGKCVRLWL